RARDALHVYVPQRYYRRPRGLEDPHSYSQVSRFLLPDTVRSTFDQIAPEVAAIPDAEALAGRASVDDYLADLWA
ncbi:MAG: hypothetical protein H0W82_10060, partial [Actinobacteria bacterium]|nr:hypothetical protein [Actinomycetota bacterium]